jgi:excisionase family DNA binding protein
MALISTTEAARRLGASPRTVKLMCADGRIPAERLNGAGQYLINESVLPTIVISPRGRPKGRNRK